MKISYILAGMVVTSHMAFAQKIELKTDVQKASYTIGQQIGKNMREQGLEIDVDILAASIKEALAAKPSQMSEQDMQQAMMQLQQTMQKKQEELAAVNLDKGKKYLEENKKKSDVKTTATGLQYKIVKEGSGESPKDESIVKVHYKGTLLDGSEFDSSYKRNKPAEFPVNGVIKGWTEALKMMKPGAKWELAIPADLAYGPMGRPGIPPNSVLLFDVELLEVQNKTAEKTGQK